HAETGGTGLASDLALAHAAAGDIGTLLPAWSALPFVGILLSIALCPLLAPRFWHHHFGKVSALWALAFAAPFVLRFGSAALHELLHTAIVDYIPFLVLIGTLFMIGGGIPAAGAFRGTPAADALPVGAGTLLACQ